MTKLLVFCRKKWNFILIKKILIEVRIGKPSPRKKRLIIVKFARYNIQKSAYSHKKRLKNTGISITESLTAFRMEQLKKAREEHSFQNVWTHDGKILFKENGSNSTKIFYG